MNEIGFISIFILCRLIKMNKRYLLMSVLPNIFAGIFLYNTFFYNECILEQKSRDADIVSNSDDNRIVKTITKYFLR